MSRTLYLPVLILVLAATSAAAAEKPDSPAQGQGDKAPAKEVAADKNDADEMICRREAVIGSNFRRKVCMTRGQRQAMQRDSQEFARENRSRAGTGVGVGNAE